MLNIDSLVKQLAIKLRKALWWTIVLPLSIAAALGAVILFFRFLDARQFSNSAVAVETAKEQASITEMMISPDWEIREKDDWLFTFDRYENGPIVQLFCLDGQVYIYRDDLPLIKDHVNSWEIIRKENKLNSSDYVPADGHTMSKVLIDILDVLDECFGSFVKYKKKMANND